MVTVLESRRSREIKGKGQEQRSPTRVCGSDGQRLRPPTEEVSTTAFSTNKGDVEDYLRYSYQGTFYGKGRKETDTQSQRGMVVGLGGTQDLLGERVCRRPKK